jgi:hypothetical protein
LNANQSPVPAPAAPQVILAFAKRVVTCLELGDVAKNPYMVFPLMALAHRVNVAHPGQVGGGGGARGQGGSRQGLRELRDGAQPRGCALCCKF